MSLLTDLRHTLRGLRRDPAYTSVALLTLALGIAANTVIFSIVDGVLLRPLAYHDSGRLVVVNEIIPELARQYPRLPVNARHYFEWRERSASFQQLAIVDSGRSVLTGLGDPAQLKVGLVSATLLPMLGVRPVLGRLFLEEEDQPGRADVVIISEGMWTQRLGRDPRVIGRSITLDGVPRTVVGVLPASFHLPKSPGGDIVQLPDKADVFRPIAFERASVSWWGELNYSVIARLKPGVTAQQALADLNVLQKGIEAHLPDRLHLSAYVAPLQEEVTGPSRTPLLFLLAAVGAVLLIVCVNLANLALARGAARARDVAIRRALGASRSQLARGILVESLSLGLAGGVLGSALGWAGLKLVLSRAPLELPRLDEIHLDARVLLFALALSVLTGLLFGLLPAWRAASSDPQRSLRDGGRSATEGRGGRLVRHALVAAESALGAVLLVVAGLLIGSFAKLLAIDNGFDAAQLLTASLSLPQRAFDKDELRETYYRNLLPKLQAIPGVTRAGLVSHLPLGGEDWVDGMQRDGENRPITELPPVNYRFCSSDYFAAMGIRVLAGGVFAERDAPRKLAVISEAAARAVWPGESAVGKKFTRGSGRDEVPFEVVGVVRDVSIGLGKQPVVTVYVPYWIRNRPFINVVLRTAADPRAAARSIRQAVWSLNPDTVIGEVETMEGILSEAAAGRRFQVVLIAAFAGSALLLACVGIFGVVSWSVARRRGEIGVRMALGARRGDVQRMVIVQGLQPVLVGLAAGLLTALGLGGVLGSLLFGVSPRDPLTYAVVGVTLAGVAALACYIPARRASSADPLEALRYE